VDIEYGPKPRGDRTDEPQPAAADETDPDDIPF
jgi:hypothetical protein